MSLLLAQETTKRAGRRVVAVEKKASPQAAFDVAVMSHKASIEDSEVLIKKATQTEMQYTLLVLGIDGEEEEAQTTCIVGRKRGRANQNPARGGPGGIDSAPRDEEGGHPKHAKKTKLSLLVHDMCSQISNQMGKFIQGVGKLDEEEVEVATTNASRVGDTPQSVSKERQKRVAKSAKEQKAARKKKGRGNTTSYE
ncbi:hypothetical protein ZWY2020_058974 [Hordeum vulgare]|nr:hypothetical protein ZWY2020_058974 [Hordeum vulgare]